MGQGTDPLRETDGITLQQTVSFKKPGEPKPPGFLLLDFDKRKGTVMNAKAMAPPPGLQAARKLRMKGRQRGFALYQAERRPGLPDRVANAHARFEMEARQALRDWLML